MTPRFLTEPTEEGTVSLIKQDTGGEVSLERDDIMFMHVLKVWRFLVQKTSIHLKVRTEDLVHDIKLKVINIYIANEVAA